MAQQYETKPDGTLKPYRFLGLGQAQPVELTEKEFRIRVGGWLTAGIVDGLQAEPDKAFLTTPDGDYWFSAGGDFMPSGSREAHPDRIVTQSPTNAPVIQSPANAPEVDPEARAVSPCVGGTVASYAGTSCSQPGVVLKFPALAAFFKSTGKVAIEPADVKIGLDSNGPNTLLISCPSFSQANAADDFSAELTFAVDGSNGTEGWLHGENATTPPHGDITASISVMTPGTPAVATSTPAVPQASATYAEGNYGVTVKISGKGVCSMKSFGIHFGVVAQRQSPSAPENK